MERTDESGMVWQRALGRYGRGDEVAASVACLAGPDAGYGTGASIDIDGGFTA